VGIVERGVEMSPVSKGHQEYTAKYVKENYDEFKVRAPKGKKEQLQAHIISTGESINAFINRAMHETMERDRQAKQGDSNEA
jgi:hypothetical protein